MSNTKKNENFKNSAEIIIINSFGFTTKYLKYAKVFLLENLFKKT